MARQTTLRARILQILLANATEILKSAWNHRDRFLANWLCLPFGAKIGPKCQKKGASGKTALVNFGELECGMVDFITPEAYR